MDAARSSDACHSERPSMDLKQLEYFVNVVELGGFSRASRLLGIARDGGEQLKLFDVTDTVIMIRFENADVQRA